jgi:hypothetical protein
MVEDEPMPPSLQKVAEETREAIRRAFVGCRRVRARLKPQPLSPTSSGASIPSRTKQKG